MGGMSVVRATVVALVVGSVGMIGTSVTVAPHAGAADPPVGTVTTFPSPANVPGAIAKGSDGALWVTAPELQVPWQIQRLSTTGVATNYTDPALQYPTAITPGPDGALWFVDSGAQSIWRITRPASCRRLPSPASS
jgi:virginiamycin B lyase